MVCAEALIVHKAKNTAMRQYFNKEIKLLGFIPAKLPTALI